MPARPRLKPSRDRRPVIRSLELRRAAHIASARTVLMAEAEAVRGLVERVGESLSEAVEAILACTGRVVVTGMGKSGFIAQKLSATFASTGTPSLYLHPAEALHGDLGRVVRDDLVLALSNSGATGELLRLLPAVGRIGARVIAVTGDAASPLARSADLVLDIGPVDEACPMGLAPTASTLALLAIGDALAMTVLANREFGSDEYALLHPGGSLGQSARRVVEVMRRGDQNPVVPEKAPLSRAVAVMTRTPGRPGATSVVDGKGRLVGIFTDGDLRRLVESGRTDFSVSVGTVCGRHPKTVRPDQLVREAAQILRLAQVDQLPVTDEAGKPVGLLDIQDVLAERL
ncbi:MAG TPA: KpsF/GutQ family sugar-phosphate isomerase [Myxococcales bacterium]|nr:KpsF/GutQ family sugar-phosphate isomerase [Myxococcales bacterium]